MLVRMAIRMKEWGMHRAPATGAAIPVKGVVGWEETVAAVGSGIASVLAGSATLAEQTEQVRNTGELAAFSECLRTIGDETRAELAERDIKDWNYSWQQASSARFAEAVAELPPGARAAGRELAEAYSHRASVLALRERELGKLGTARERWQQRVDAAVQSGDADAADRWVQSGADVFVAPGEMEQKRRQVRSRACAARWQAGLARAPMQTLADFDHATPEQLPSEREAHRRLQGEVERCRRTVRRDWAHTLAARLENEEETEAEEWQAARRAGLLSEQQLADAMASPRTLNTAGRCDWLRRICEVAAPEEERTALMLDIATAPIPLEQRRDLLTRLAQTADVEVQDRRTLSRSLWQLYNSGALGCPGDETALSRLEELLEQGTPLLAREGAESAARWVDYVRNSGNRWVCFEPDNNH